MLDKARNEQRSLKCFASIIFVAIVIILPNWLLTKPPPQPWTGRPRQLKQDFLCPGDRLHPGDSMKSANGLIQMQFQLDGNLVIYNRNNSCFSDTPKCAIWSSNTNGQVRLNHHKPPWSIHCTPSILYRWNFACPFSPFSVPEAFSWSIPLHSFSFIRIFHNRHREDIADLNFSMIIIWWFIQLLWHMTNLQCGHLTPSKGRFFCWETMAI